MEGDFERTSPDKFRPGERADIKKPQDNLHPEGEFERPVPTKYGPGGRAPIVKHPDNLKMEGDFERTTPDKFHPGERADIKKPQDNLHPEGEFERPVPTKYGPGGRAPIVKHPDNLRMEGEFERPMHQDYKPGDRADVIKHPDNLKSEGDLYIKRSTETCGSTKIEKSVIVRHSDTLQMQGDFVDLKHRDDYKCVQGERAEIRKYPDNLKPEGEFVRPRKNSYEPGDRGKIVLHPDNLKVEGVFQGSPRSKEDFMPGTGERATIKKPQDNLMVGQGKFQGMSSNKSQYREVRGERVEVKKQLDSLHVGSGSMDMKTTSSVTFQNQRKSSFAEPTKASVNKRRHMESSISLGDDHSSFMTSNRKTSTVQSSHDKLLQSNQKHQDTKKHSTTETKTLADGSIVTITREVTSATLQQGASMSGSKTQQQNKSSYSTNMSNESSNKSVASGISHQIDECPIQISRQSDLVRNRHSDQTNTSQSIEHSSSMSNVSKMSESRRSSSSRQSVMSEELLSPSRQSVTSIAKSASSSEVHQQQNRMVASSSEFRQALGSDSTHAESPSGKPSGGHHRKSVITSSSADVTNAVLHRKSMTTSTEALHTVSSAAAAQRKSISNLRETGQYISNSSQSHDRKSLTALHRQEVQRSSTEHSGVGRRSTAWASSYQQQPRQEKVVQRDNLQVGGGHFYGQSEAKSYGNFQTSTRTSSEQRVTAQTRRANSSHITLGESSSASSSSAQTSSLYRKEFVPRHSGTCPATLLETTESPFQHKRDTTKHKFYLPKVSN